MRDKVGDCPALFLVGDHGADIDVDISGKAEDFIIGDGDARGFLVDGEGKPGGGGLLLLQASDYAAALALIQQDPMLLSGGVEWELQEWISSVGQLATDAPSQSFTR